jgi:hypothetical protein
MLTLNMFGDAAGRRSYNFRRLPRKRKTCEELRALSSVLFPQSLCTMIIYEHAWFSKRPHRGSAQAVP